MAKEKVVYVTEEKRSGGGCLSKILIGFVVLTFIAAIGGSVSDDNGNSNTGKSSSATYTSRPTKNPTKAPTATPKPTATPTPKPTATPTPTATPEPNYGEMAPEEAAQLLAQTYGNGMSFKSASEFGGIVLLEMKLEPFLTEKYAVRDCCTFSLRLAEHIFDNKTVEKVKITYFADGRDQYGNETTARAMEITLNRETAEKINYDYMRDHLYSSTYDYLSITDEYYVHPSLNKGVYD